MRELTRRLENVELRIAVKDDAKRWERQRAHWKAFEPILRGRIEGRITEEAYNAWRAEHPSPDHGRVRTPAELARGEELRARLKAKLDETRERLQLRPELRTA